MAFRTIALTLAAATSLGLAACDKAKEPSPQQQQSANTPAGTTGSGTNAMGGPGVGLAGGMNPAPGKPTGVSNGSANSTPSKSVGNRGY